MASSSGGPWWLRGLSMLNDNPMLISRTAGALTSAAKSIGTQVRRNRESRLMQSKTRGKIMGSARYAGKFKKGTRKGAKKGGKFTTVATNEVSGTVVDANCVYIVHTAADSYQVIRYMMQEMIRKVMARAGFIVHSPTEAFQSNQGLVSTVGFTIRIYEQQNALNALADIASHTFGASETLLTLTNILIPAFINFSSGATSTSGTGNDFNGSEPIYMCLFDNKTIETLVATVDFREEKIEMYSKSLLKVQNRTLSGDGTAGTDNVNANPLTGYSYTFNGVPKAKPKTMFAFNRIQTNLGVALIKGSSIGTEPALREPPLPRVFWNCKKAAKLTLQPGSIKTAVCSDKIVGNILTILKRIRHQNTAAPEFEICYSPFNHQMIALEEMINVDPEESITVSYEVDRKIYIKSTTKRSPGTAMANYTQSTLNNL